MIYIYSLLAGFVSFISPCIIPMLTVYFSTITGLSINELMDENKSRESNKLIIKNTLLFILAFTIVFSIAGSAATVVSKLITKNIQILNIIGGIFIIFFGLGMLGIFKVVCKSMGIEAWLSKKQFKSNGLTAFFTGLFFAIACSHCIGPILYSLLVYIGISSYGVNGTLAMIMFSIGLGIPFFISGLFLKKVIRALKRFKPYQGIITKIIGVILIGFGIMLLTDKFTAIVSILYNISPIKKLPIGM